MRRTSIHILNPSHVWCDLFLANFVQIDFAYDFWTGKFLDFYFPIPCWHLEVCKYPLDDCINNYIIEVFGCIFQIFNSELFIFMLRGKVFSSNYIVLKILLAVIKWPNSCTITKRVSAKINCKIFTKTAIYTFKI